MEIHPQVPLLAERGEEILPTVDLNYLKFSILCLRCDLPSRRNQTLRKAHLGTLLSCSSGVCHSKTPEEINAFNDTQFSLHI